MARTRAEDESKRSEIARERAERIAVIFDCHTGGVSRQQLADEAEVPERSLGYLMVWMRKNATEVERLATCLQIGGEWIYGWAHVLDDHLREHHKRRKSEARSLAVSVESLTQSYVEQPGSLALQRQLASAKARLIVVEQEIGESAGLIRSLAGVRAA
jgi:hypothetical protein